MAVAWWGNCNSEFQSHSLHKGKADYRRLNFFMSELSSFADAVGHTHKKKVITVNRCWNSPMISTGGNKTAGKCGQCA